MDTLVKCASPYREVNTIKCLQIAKVTDQGQLIIFAAGNQTEYILLD